MSDLNVKVGLIGKLDMLKFKNMAKVREKAIQKAPAKEISGTFPVNENAKALHPDALELTVDNIIARGGAKTFVLKRANPGGFAADRLLRDLKPGDKLIASAPQGFFYYEDLRDAGHVVGLAGGSGITPFLSMARAIADGIEDFSLTLLYGSRREEDVLFRGELDEIARSCPKFKVIYVLSDEERDCFEHGFLTAELIRKYAPADEDYSVFLCGPEAMYRFLQPEIEELGLPPRRFRRKLIDVTKSPWACEGYPAEAEGKSFSIRVKQGPEEWTVPASADEPVLVAIERAGIKAPSRCRAGECGWCRSRLLEGTVFIPKENEMRRWADVHYGYIHPCCSFPTSDLVLEIPGEFY